MSMSSPAPTPDEEMLDTEPPRSRALHLLTFAVFALALVFPWVAGALGASDPRKHERERKHRKGEEM